MKAGIRSLLFVPANARKRLDGASGRGADALVLDLEDAVPPGEKDLARDTMVDFVETFGGREELIVRVNAPGTPWFDDDWAAAVRGGVDAIMVPKATQAGLAVTPSGTPVIALIETAMGVEEAREVAVDPRVVRLMLGSADLAADLGSTLRADELDLLYPRSRVAYASASAGIEGPIDVVHLALDDADGLERSARLSRDLGFTGKACIHPRQLDVVNGAYTPDVAEVIAAEAVVAALEQAQSGGALAVHEGRLIDPPVAARAMRTLNAARRETSGKDRN